MRPLETSEPGIDRRQLDVELGAAVLAARQTGSIIFLHLVSVCFMSCWQAGSFILSSLVSTLSIILETCLSHTFLFLGRPTLVAKMEELRRAWAAHKYIL